MPRRAPAVMPPTPEPVPRPYQTLPLSAVPPPGTGVSSAPGRPGQRGCPPPAPSAPLPSAHYFSALAMCSSASLIFCAAISPARRAGLGRAPPPPCAAATERRRDHGHPSGGRSGPGPACCPRLRRARSVPSAPSDPSARRAPSAPSAPSAAGRPRAESPGCGLGRPGCAALRGRRALRVLGRQKVVNKRNHTESQNR